MSNERKLCLIKDLKPFRDEWRLTLKLLHSWKQTTSYGGDTLECVLVDQTGAKIQASCKRSQITRVQRYLRVGEWKVIDTVKITGVGVGQYRPTTQQYKMTIIGDTSITPSDYRNDNHFLNLANYEEIGNGKLKPHFLIDIMGQVTDLGPVAMVQAKGNDTKRVHFRLRDTSGHEVACCLWGKYAEQFESVEEANDESIICLIRFAKISEYRGEKQITNAFDASLVFLNPTMEEAIDFKQKMLNDPLPLAILDQSNEKKIITRVAHDWNEVDVRCISEILQSFELLAIDHINENSSEDVSTPSNKRKEDECDQMDMTSTSKKLCTNIIKVEKTKTD
ncbi:hypothetical protein HID58_050428 [Brassica napus]|uniref:DUF223 domain-containing protein n=1 Tax=Brassica napus TaxID=3708 RepID=A0ABQ8A637_BRANA|nr:replication protein A 70 kDa DNA-binding subunit A-like [Brassica napus]KAH0887999.1 hypothetical protein HID58_050428 [Brassica napus]